MISTEKANSATNDSIFVKPQQHKVLPSLCSFDSRPAFLLSLILYPFFFLFFSSSSFFFVLPILPPSFILFFFLPIFRPTLLLLLQALFFFCTCRVRLTSTRSYVSSLESFVQASVKKTNKRVI